MEFRPNSGDQPSEQEEVSSSNQASPSSEDQRARPRFGTLEKIADIAYDTLRKHEGPSPSGDGSESSGTPEDSQ